MSRVLVLGSGGHGKVVADILLQSGCLVLGFLDDDRSCWDVTRLGLPVLGGIETFRDHIPTGLVVGVGSNRLRQEIVERLGHGARHLWANAIHPRATVSPSVVMGQGVVVVAGAIINADAALGDHSIINTGATIDHDCRVGDYSHIAPGANLAGGVTVGVRTFIGIGAAVVPGVTIGNDVVIGAGAVVIDDVPDDVTAKGLPARW